MMQTDHLDELLICRLDLGRRIIEPCSIVIFGASGDLTARKLIPALYHLFIQKQLPDPFRIIGFARREKTDESWREEMRDALAKFSRTKNIDAAQWKAFAANIVYCRGEFGDESAYRGLSDRLASFKNEQLQRNLLFYLFWPFMALFALVAIPICLVFSLGDLGEEPNNHLVIARRR